MRYVSRLALALLFSSTLALPPAAQTQHRRRVTRPSTEVHVDLPTGTITRGAAVHQRAAATVSDFPNMDLTGFVGVDTGGGAIEWFNDGVKGLNHNASDLMESFTFAYCSAKKDPSLGGPGGTARLGFYEGYTRLGALDGTPNGTAVAVLTLAGLPANTASSSFLGGFGCYFATVHFGSLVSFADGPIGYSWKFMDLGTDGVLAATFPGLANTAPCGSGGTDPVGQGGYDCCSFQPADVYLNGLLHVVLTFVPYCFPYSIGIDMHEAADLSATASPFTGDGLNADALSASPAILGQGWSAHVALGHTHGTGGVVQLNVRTSVFNGPNVPSPIGGRLMEPLIAGPMLATLSSTHDGTASAPIAATVPPQFGLLCLAWSAQATVAGGGFVDLSSAVSGVTGTQ